MIFRISGRLRPNWRRLIGTRYALQVFYRPATRIRRVRQPLCLKPPTGLQILNCIG